MGRPNVIQVPLKDLEQRFYAYMKNEQITSNAEAGRNLFDLALRILENDDEGVTNRQLLEEIYIQTKKSGAVINMVHGQTYDRDKMKQVEVEAAETRRGIVDGVVERVKEWLAK
ncbi:hypothetical protein OPW19_21475 [Vibrio europaeus]|uniref:hypothetical protein n=1 Tax=Vibrio oreintalis group TaxID=1891919 RepID=UPI0018A767EB|nr:MULTISPECIES: hypothetical protein [Vibrio oreintalis group]MCG9578521.1 hypothetical protein [Vibrio tubiashii]MDC5808793.1 hypothetical protein [Vibrio europaeus]MDC5822393.1 hypothetical protein [Vibrio europaeus]QPG38049.1 hypothetical protein IXK98_25445 [Vibrio europaeus]